MTVKIKLLQYVFFIKPRNLDTAGIRCFRVVYGFRLLLLLRMNFGVALQLSINTDTGGGRVERRCWVNLQCRGVLLVWMIVGQGLIALAIGAGGVVWTFFLSSIFSVFFLLLFGRRPDID